MKIYTKTGDKGQTSLFDNVRVDKDDIRVESYGTIDELMSSMGVAKNFIDDEKTVEEITDIQNKLFTVGAQLATRDGSKLKFKITDEDISKLEALVDEYMAKVGGYKGFIVPGTNRGSGFLHLSRTICRRAERHIITLGKTEEVDEKVLCYINRLSDALYAMASYYETERNRVQYK